MIVVFSFFASVIAPLQTQAATIVTTAGVTETFDLQPLPTEWSTFTDGGAAGDVTTTTAVDARVTGFFAANIIDQLQFSFASPRAAGAATEYDATALNVQTRPTGVGTHVLMATLENGSGAAADALTLEYDLGVDAPAGESLLGHRVYFSLDGSIWTNIASISGVGTAGRLSTSLDLTSWANGAQLFLLWVDDNGSSSPDTGYSLDNFRFAAVQTIVGRNLLYNRTHTAGGAPNGSLQAGAGNYWLEGATPTAFATNDVANFSQDGDTSIDVPADITVGGINVTNATGTYTIGGAGRIRGPFTKSNAGTALFTSANNFTKSAITGGTVETRAGALGSGTVDMSGGALWKVTTTAQTQLGQIGVGPGGATIQTDMDLTATGIGNGTGALTKTGAGALILVGSSGDASGGLIIQTGKLSLGNPTAVGGPAQTVTMNGNLLEFINAGEANFTDGTDTRKIILGAFPTTIAVTDLTGGVVMLSPDTVTASGTITKTGDGALRMRADQPGLTSNWVVELGTLEAEGFGALGSGTVTANAGTRLAGRNSIVTNNVTLAGAELGTRTGDLTDFQGAINVTADSTAALRSYTTIANGQHMTISGVLSGTGNLRIDGTPASNVNGAKALILTNTANTYTGTITVTFEQSLVVNGNLAPTSNVVVDGRLGGRGVIGSATVNAGSTLAPGLFVDTAAAVQPNPVFDGPGILTAARNVTLGATAIFAVDLDHGFGLSPVAGTDYDQLVVGTGAGPVSTGSVLLGGSELVLTLGFNPIQPNDLFFIILNDGIDPIPDTFNNLPNGSLMTLGGQPVQISYSANSTTGFFTGGNDVALFAIPEPGCGGLLMLGSTLLALRRRRSSS